MGTAPLSLRGSAPLAPCPTLGEGLQLDTSLSSLTEPQLSLLVAERRFWKCWAVGADPARMGCGCCRSRGEF